MRIIDLCLAPLPGLGHRLLEHPDDLGAQLVDALLHPEDRDDGGVDGGEVVIVGNLGHVHVDLEAGLGTQRCPGDILDVKPEPMFLLKINFDQLTLIGALIFTTPLGDEIDLQATHEEYYIPSESSECPLSRLS